MAWILVWSNMKNWRVWDETWRGMMIISVNDIPEMREVFQGFDMDSVPIRYSLNSNQPTQRRELIITVK